MAKLLSERYEISKTVNNHTVKIYVEITDDDEVTIQNDKKQAQFNFTRSHQDLVKAMALAMFEAAELVTDRKTKDGGEVATS